VGTVASSVLQGIVSSYPYIDGTIFDRPDRHPEKPSVEIQTGKPCFYQVADVLETPGEVS